MGDYSDTQRKVMRFVCRNALNKGSDVQIAGNGRGPWLSACRALVRKGMMKSWHSGKYGLTPEGQPVAEQMLAEWRETTAAARSELSAKDGGATND